MAVFRIEKTRDYTVMSNYHLRDRSAISATDNRNTASMAKTARFL